MFGKLIKNEFRGTWKFMVTIFASFALLTVFGGVSVRILSTADYPGLLPILTLMLYVMSFFVVFFGILIYLGNRYYKTMYSTQGYLTHTLPATETSIFCSKVLVSSIWMLAGVLLMVLSIYTMGDIGSEGELHREIHDAFTESGIIVSDGDSNVVINNRGIVVDDGETHVSIGSNGIIVDDGGDSVRVTGTGQITINGKNGTRGKDGNVTINGKVLDDSADDFFTSRMMKHPKRTFWSFAAWGLLNTFLGLTVMLLWIFASMAIGQLSDKHRTLCSILAGIGFYVLNQIFGISVIIDLVTTIERWSPDRIAGTIVYGTPAFLLVVIAAFSALCLFINHKKLNLA